MVHPEVTTFLMAFLGGFLGAFVSTETVRRFAVRIGAVDHPGGRRVHRSPTARLGGIGIAVGLAVALAFLLGLQHTAFDGRLLAGLVGAGVIALLVGVVDDVRGLGAGPKIVGQTVAAILLWYGGWRVDGLGLPGLGVIDSGVMSLPLTVLWVVGVINAVNLIDGLDGLAGGLAFVSALGFAALFAIAGYPSWTIAVAFAGATAGFLWFNLSPALIFMGDAGSHLLGLLLAAFGLRASQILAPGMFPLVPMLLLAVPLGDLAWAVLRRVRAPEVDGTASPGSLRSAIARVARADGAHIHHRLLAAGCTPRVAVGILWRIATLCAAVGVTIVTSPWIAVALSTLGAGWLARALTRTGGIEASIALRRADEVAALLALEVREMPEATPSSLAGEIEEIEEIAA